MFKKCFNVYTSYLSLALSSDEYFNSNSYSHTFKITFEQTISVNLSTLWINYYVILFFSIIHVIIVHSVMHIFEHARFLSAFFSGYIINLMCFHRNHISFHKLHEFMKKSTSSVCIRQRDSNISSLFQLSSVLVTFIINWWLNGQKKSSRSLNSHCSRNVVLKKKLTSDMTSVHL